MAVDRERVAAAVRELLAAIGDDPARPGLRETPRRVAEAYADYFSGVGQDASAHLDPGELAGERGELVLLRDIEFRSMCEHHLLPFTGIAHVAYLPGDRIVGLGRIPRVVETIASRPQIQERLTDEIADALVAGLEPRGVLVVVDAVHGCVGARGSRQVKSSTVTVASRGQLAEPIERAEIMALIGERR
ncbi:GTP cyclohydrolase I FolE [Agrococcus sp. HG114]|uniref:GTP cyclohydrolase I FolE n=1 Tax=Agrococcus sp. HG114 TaxID=2969757 RepID=UPI00215A26C2|nr:GTP cyclohydrolase I FolE [Agrococcus sp. HG114]MCR8670055.1 GTP cyclohydrolase I FolE [Agrococcus sp. HG114]